MNRTAIIVTGAIAALIIGGVVVWLVATSTAQVTEQPQTSNPSSSSDVPSASDQQDPSPSTPAVDTASVAIQDMAFSPSKITIKKGATVTWTNQDGVGHDVVSDSNSPAGGPPSTNDLLSVGDTYSFTFDTVGTFTYHCSLHPNMHGTIEVVE